jgi:hypothetical protein
MESVPKPDFDQVVAAALTEADCDVRARVGTGASALDLAIVDGAEPGRYRMALACDGPSDHAARSARDRDRLRPQVLQSLGWRLRRVWSTDWVRNPEGEQKRLLAALQETSGPDRDAAQPPAPAVVNGKTADVPPTFKPSKWEGERGNPPPSVIPTTAEAFEREDGPDTDLSPSGFPAYRVAQLPDDLGGQDPATLTPERLAALVAAVVVVEGPVHVDEVVRRIADAAGVKRTGSRLQSAIESACDLANARGAIRRRADFLWHPSMEEPVVRDRGALPAPSRKLDLIAPEEVARAVEAIVVASFGIEPEALPAAVGRAFGFARIGDEFRARVGAIVQSSITSGRLSLQGEHVIAPAAPTEAEPLDPLSG